MDMLRPAGWWVLALILVLAGCVGPRWGDDDDDDDVSADDDDEDDDAGDDDTGDDDTGDDDTGDDDTGDDDTTAAGEPNEDPLGAMYFNPYWAIHTLSDNCAVREDPACAYEALGLSSIKFNDLKWQYIEADAPSNGNHTYDWSVLDDAVLRWEDAGARRVIFHLAPASPWGVLDSRTIAEDVFGLPCDQIAGNCEDYPANPRPEHWGDWEAWVTEMCERYDGDGVGDIAGLQHAHLEFQLINEAQNFFFYFGTSEHYQELLQHTRAALDACNADARILHYGLTFNGLSHGGVSDEVFWERVDEMASSFDPQFTGPAYAHAMAMMLGSPEPAATYDVVPTVSMCPYFDVMAMHCNQSIEHMIEEHAFLRDKLDTHGCESTPIICDDSTSAPTLYSVYELEWWDSSYGGADMTGEQIHEALGSGYAAYDFWCDPTGSIPPSGLTEQDARTWHDHYHAAFAVKKASTALALGMTRFMAGLLEDWGPESGCYWMHQGLAESEGSILFPLWYGDPRPVYHSYGLLRDKVTGYVSATREVVDDVTILTFTRQGPGGDPEPVHLVWYLDDALPFPGDPEQTQPFTLEVGTSTARVTHLITEAGIDTPTTEVVEAPGGVYSGVAAQTPFFIEPIPE